MGGLDDEDENMIFNESGVLLFKYVIGTLNSVQEVVAVVVDVEEI